MIALACPFTGRPGWETHVEIVTGCTVGCLQEDNKTPFRHEPDMEPTPQ